MCIRDSFETKGDANKSPDSWPGLPGVPEDYVVGKVVAVIPRVGLVVLFFKSPAGAAVLCALAALLIAWYLADLASRRQSVYIPQGHLRLRLT